MSVQPTALATPPMVSRTARQRRDRWFFSGMAGAAALTVMAGFAPTYYLRGLSSAPPLSALLHLHGFLFTAWILIFLVQTLLIAGHRPRVHRRLGATAAVLVGLLPVVGFLAAIDAGRRGFDLPPGAPPSLVFLAVPLADLVVFCILAGLGLYFRQRRDVHKRLMTVATISILTPAIGRLPLVSSEGPLVYFGLTNLFLVACLIFDRRSLGRIHPAFLWSSLLLVASQPLRLAIAGTDAWLAVARWLTR
jgi:hypothetical protein